MNTKPNRRFPALALTLAALGAWTPALLAAGFTVTPATIANNYVGKITLTITGITTGQAVMVERYADLNGNGMIDSGEPLLQAGRADDGVVSTIGGVRNLNVPGDEDGAANGQIRVEPFYPSVESGLDVIACKQVIRVSDPLGGFTAVTQPFEVTQAPLPQGVSGTLTAAGGAPLARVMVVLLPGGDGSPLTGTVTDSSGNYTLRSVPGNFMALPLAPGFVSDFNSTATVSADAFATLNLALPTATRTISGKVKDSSSAIGIPGIFVMSDGDNGFAAAFTDLSGNYSLGVLPGSWQVSASEGSLARIGYVGLQTKPVADTTSGNVTNLDLAVNPATALIYGILKTTLNAPLVGIEMWSDDQTGQYQAAGRTYPATADYCLGVRPGSWWVGPSSDALGPLGYISQGTSVTVVTGQALRADFVATPANAHLKGRVVDELGAPVPFIQLYASNYQGGSSDGQTNGDGYFDLLMTGGTWHLKLNSNDAAQNHLVGPELTFTLTDNQTTDNIDFVVLDAPWTISGYVSDGASQPVTAWVSARAEIDGLTYVAEAQTSGGNYTLPVCNGTWQIYVNANGYPNPTPLARTVNSNHEFANFTLQPVVPLVITTTSLPNGTVGVNYSAQLSATGGQQPYTWHLPGGTASLPPSTTGNMNFSSNGTISGIPTTPGTYSFQVGIWDSGSQSTLGMVSLTIQPASGPEIAVFDGNGTAGPERQSNSSAFFFPSIVIGTTSTTQTFTIKNTGTQNLTGLAISKTGTYPGDFITGTLGTTTLAPNATTTVTVNFRPTAGGGRPATVRIASNDADENPFIINVGGVGLSTQEGWRETYFGSPANSGNGTDLYDYDHDGLVNLLEYAFGLNPTLNSAGLLPRPQRVGPNLVLSFTQPVGVTGINYGAEWSESLQAADWHAVSDTGTGSQHTFSVPMAGKAALFMRHRIIGP